MRRTTYGYMSTHKRFWEIDLLRTVAIAMMITFHTLYLLQYFYIHNTGVPGMPYGFWWWFPRVTGGTFIFVAGVSLTITYSRSKRISGFMLRGLKILAWGMGITLITWLISREGYVRFGILHFFGIAFILAPFFLRFRFINLILGAALMAAGIYLQVQGIYFDFPWLLWLGLMPRGFWTLDYWPLLPWFGLFLVGMFGGKMLYPQGNRRLNIHEFSNPVTSALTLPGRHPLVIYLAQWPIVIGVLLALYPAKVLPYFPS
ncbi:MAG: heparan-alpha-glucosaminide N-acetyltransferase [Dehalococcoidia bacterium]